MVDPIEPISSKKKKKITFQDPLLVVPPPIVPKWGGGIVPHHFAQIIFTNAIRVVEATLENFQWEKKKREEQIKDQKASERIHRDQKRFDHKYLLNRVALIPVS